jgi:hypothetical protein
VCCLAIISIIILCVFRPLQRRFLLCWLGFSHEIDMPIYTSLPRSAIIFLYYLGVKASIRIVLAIDMTGHKSNLVLLPRTLGQCERSLSR